jgi:cytochrome b561
MYSEIRYSSTAIALHWFMAMMIIGLIAVGFYMSSQKITPSVIKLYMTHKSVGLCVLALAMIRIIWRLTHKPPALPAMPNWQAKASHISHALLYALMVMMPLSGWLMNSATGTPMKLFGMLKIPSLIEKSSEQVELWKNVHGIFAWGLVVLISVHIMAAIKHQFFQRDGLMRRMWFR